VGLINWLDPHVDRYILTTADEHKVVEVHKHWAVMVWPAVRVAAGVVIFVSAFAFQGSIYWILVFLGLVLGMQALWRILEEYRDRFVITNQRVFRVHGVLATARASVPLLRILDITVNKPVIGRWLNYGHFVFESAAQVQGLNKITFVKDIDQREDVLRMVMSGDMPQQISASAVPTGCRTSSTSTSTSCTR
jgi:membrane protein YdbS with pleckstrin-like domain